MSIELDKLELSPPLHYSVFSSYFETSPIRQFEIFSTEQLRPLHSAMPPKAALALKLIEYMAIQEAELLDEVIDTVKVFCIALHLSEVFNKAPKEALLQNLVQKGTSDEKALNKAIASYRGRGKILKEKIYGSYTGNYTDYLINGYPFLKHFYSNYEELPAGSKSKPNKANILNYPSLYDVIELLERNLDVPEANIVLPILYILTGHIDKAIEFYENKDTMEVHDLYNLGTAYLEKRNLSKAREYLSEVAMMERASYNLALTYIYDEEWMDAIRWLYISTSSLHAMRILLAVSGQYPYEWQIINQRTCNNLGICHYYGEGAFRKSLICFDLASAWRYFTGSGDGIANRSRIIQDQLDIVEPGRKERKEFHGIIGGCDAMQDVYDKIKKFVPYDSSVLITGESGTGKELVAQVIHKLSERSGRLVPHNCAVIPVGLEEATLFGHEKGVFTGADRDRKGLFEQANGGTLLLDELGSLSLGSQARILRVIEDKMVRKIGSEEEPDKVDVRILLATNENLEEAVRNKQFREDLYFRVKVFEIHLPPLHERDEDIPLLIDYFIEKHSKSIGKQICGINEDARILLSNYSWPGNVRELSLVVERAVVMTDEEVIRRCDIPEEIQNELKSNESVKIQMIESALTKNKGNVLKTSVELDYPRTTLRRLIKKYKIDPKRFKPSK